MKNYIIAIALAGILSACSSVSEPTITSEKHVPSQEHIVNATLFTQQAAEYRALCYQAYNLASMKLVEALKENPTNPAVLLDLDETVLDNSPYFGWQIKQDKPFTPATWSQWVAKGEADAIPGVTDFLHLADSLDVSLFYVSNRDTSGLMPTMKNMQVLGMPQTEKDHYLLKSTTSDKSERRQAILDKGHTILLFIGDNLGDYQSIWDKPTPNDKRKSLVDEHHLEMGNNFIVLPNALYGTWLASVYNFDYNQSDSLLYKERIEVISAATL